MKRHKSNLLRKEPMSCLTAYSSTYAQILDGNVDIILVGDSLGNTVYGMKNTRNVTMDMMMMHGKAVKKYVKKSLTIIDMPFKSYENKKQAYNNAKELLRTTKINYIKIEVNKKKLPIVKHLSEKGINLVAHIGVTPQSYKNFKNIKIKGRNKREFNELTKLAKDCETLGAKIILLEGITKKLSDEINDILKVPTIGIGASEKCNGQILVTDDIINLSLNNKKPKFVKNYINFKKLLEYSVKKFSKEVKVGKFPGKKNTYT